MVGVAGATVIEVSVGFTKKPRQLIAKAKVASAAKAPARRSLEVIEDIFIHNSLGRACLSSRERLPTHFRVAKIVAEIISPQTHMSANRLGGGTSSANSSFEKERPAPSNLQEI